MSNEIARITLSPFSAELFGARRNAGWRFENALSRIPRRVDAIRRSRVRDFGRETTAVTSTRRTWVRTNAPLPFFAKKNPSYWENEARPHASSDDPVQRSIRVTEQFPMSVFKKSKLGKKKGEEGYGQGKAEIA
jgi:hypothetical protein